MKRIKQVILVRRDLNMRRGKEIAQGSHASMAFLLDRIENETPWTENEKLWMNEGQAKVCLQVSSEEELLKFFEEAKAAGLPSFVIRDSGRTEFAGQPTFTACGIGPDEAEKIDAVTGKLKLY
jgi:PTH2 family peptidyl-tRNA hydrolase